MTRGRPGRLGTECRPAALAARPLVILAGLDLSCARPARLLAERNSELIRQDTCELETELERMKPSLQLYEQASQLQDRAESANDTGSELDRARQAEERRAFLTRAPLTLRGELAALEVPSRRWFPPMPPGPDASLQVWRTYNNKLEERLWSLRSFLQAADSRVRRLPALPRQLEAFDAAQHASPLPEPAWVGQPMRGGEFVNSPPER